MMNGASDGMADSDARLDILAAVLLAAASGLSAWSAFQGSLWGGIQATAYARSNVMQTEATRLDLEAGRQRTERLALLHAWLDAAATGDGRRMAFYEAQLPDGLSRPFQAWKAGLPADFAARDARSGGARLELPPIDPPSRADAERARAEAKRLLGEGEAANSHGDRFGLVSVLMSIVLFLAGISQPMRRPGVRRALGLLAAALLIGSCAYMAVIPVAPF